MSSSVEEKACPLCVNKLDNTDIQLSACQCGYQVCVFCYDKILKSDSPLCPACRRPYSSDNTDNANHITINNNVDEISNKKKEKNTKSKKKKEKEKDQQQSNNNMDNNDNNNDESHHSHLSYDELSNIRVRQKNLVYVVGLPVSLCDEITLKTSKWFGQFGRIKKVYCNKKTSHVSRTGSFAAFITFYKEKDAFNAIQSMNGYYLDDGRMLKATTGSTKYCSYFLRGSNCSNPLCLYLHEWASKDDVVTKEELNDFGHPSTNNNNTTHINNVTNSYSNHTSINNHDHHHQNGEYDAIHHTNHYHQHHHIDYDENDDYNTANHHPRNRSARTRVALTTSSKAASTDNKIAKFDYTRIVKKGMNLNANNNAVGAPTEFPPLGTKSQSNISNTPSPMMKPLNNNKKRTKTPPAKPQKHIQMRTKPPMGHHTKRRINDKQITPQIIYSNITTSKSEKLSSSKKNDETRTPPKISLDDANMNTTNNNHHKNMTRPTVNFDSHVDIVGDTKINKRNNNKIHIESKVNVQRNGSIQPTSSLIKLSMNTSNKMAAQILLDELLKNKQMDSTKDDGFKLSDLLKDGFVGDDELIMNDYNYYFLQSDELIFAQFHNHWNYTRQQQKSKA